MVNQTTVNSDYVLESSFVEIDATLVSAVVTLYGNNLELLGTCSNTVADNIVSISVDGALLTEIGTYRVNVLATFDDSSIQAKNEFLDINKVVRTRYCYQVDIKRKLIDIMLPDDFDLGSYSARSSNEIDRALQGLYELPLVPTSEMDILSLQELASDIGAGYALEDLTILADNRSNYHNNNLKTTGFAELNRYVRMEKEFSSIPKASTKSNLRYEFSIPRISGYKDDVCGTDIKDPLNRYYDGTRRINHG